MAKGIIVSCLAVTSVILAGRVSGLTLKVTSCEFDFAGTRDEDVTFLFCRGGSYCDAVDEVPLPADSGIEIYNSTFEVPVDLGYIPTTMDIKKSTDGHDSVCITSVVWEDGDNLLGEDGSLILESETGWGGCIEGLADELVIACKRQWRFFNLDSSSDYVYDIRVKACSGTSSGSVQAYLCSHASCNGTIGEEVNATLTPISGDEYGWTHTEIRSGFNPVAMRLSEVDESWCAEELTFNLFLVVSSPTYAMEFNYSVNGVASMIVRNIQANGMTSTPAPFAITPAPIVRTPAPIAITLAPFDIVPATRARTPAPTPVPTVLPSTEAPVTTIDTGDESATRWLDAAWEIAVTIAGAASVAGIAGVTTMICKRRAARREEE